MPAAPFVAIGMGLYLLHDAWITILLYHALIILGGICVPRRLAVLRKGFSPAWLLRLGLPAALAGPLLLLLEDPALLPGLELRVWFADHGLSGTSLLLFLPYYGLLHPFIEQFHWDVLRRDRRLGALAHPLFAAYHLLVLVLLLRPVWAAVSFALLLGASWTWAHTRERLGGLATVAVSHLFADAALVSAAYWIAIR
ncbi:MAG: hypothetical protein GF330_09855 [Candidatus Eisenbacteria bacterium]|nr:hypothetical protein [Candidatus Eisenbacteria bacterium]